MISTWSQSLKVRDSKIVGSFRMMLKLSAGQLLALSPVMPDDEHLEAHYTMATWQRHKKRSIYFNFPLFHDQN